MKVGVRAWEAFGSASRGVGWENSVAYVTEAEKLGADIAWTGEAWALDAVSTAGYLAARTSRIRIGTAIMQITARPPAMAAMTAATLAAISNNRFVLGLGMSNPQLVEGLHSVRFRHPIARIREYVEIVRRALRGEKIDCHGEHYEMPLPGGEGKAMALALPDGVHVPIHLATLGPAAMRLTGAIADGWLGQSFTPEGADGFLPYLQAGARAAGRDLSALDLSAGGEVEFGDDVEAMADRRRHHMAFRLGGMGSARTNFYTEAYIRGGFADEAREVQRLWLAGDHDAARAAVPRDLILRTHFLGTRAMVKERVRRMQAAGVTTLRVEPRGKDLAQRVATLGEMITIVREVEAEAASAATPPPAG